MYRMKNAGKKIGAAIKKVYGWIKELFLLPVKVYRKYFSGMKSNPTCRFSPTCSEYALIAVREWGMIIGTVLAVVRIVRCNPFSRGGEDPVPLRKDVKKKIKDFFTSRFGKKHSKKSNSNGENNV